MLIEMLPGTDNVIRFPVEMRKRPSMRLLYQLQPDVRTLFMHAEGLGFELPPHDLRDRTDHATAGHIAAHLDDDGRAPQSFLEELLEPLLERAVEASRHAFVAAKAVTVAQERAESAHAPDVLKERALEAMQHAVRLGLEAHMLCEETAVVSEPSLRPPPIGYGALERWPTAMRLSGRRVAVWATSERRPPWVQHNVLYVT